MTRRTMRALAVAGCGMLGVSLSACESTEQESAKLSREGQQLVAGQGSLKLGAVNHSVKVSDVSLLSDAGRAAVAMRLTGRSSQLDVPIALDVTAPSGKLLYSNETGGLEASLQHASLPHPGQGEWWVDDQVLLPQGSSSASAKVSVRVGTGTTSHASTPVLRAAGVQAGEQDGMSTVSGTIVGSFPSATSKAPVFVVALRGGKVVAAGRALVNAPSAHGEGAPFQIFLVGNAAGATLQPTVSPASG